MSSAPLDAILARIAGAGRILIFGHVGPDGDALGSALGLMWLLQSIGKEAGVSFEDPVPATFNFLPGAPAIANRPVEDHDLVIAVDGSDATRYGAYFSEFLARDRRPALICIDHHRTNTHFADLNWVDSEYTATAQMLYHLACHAGWTLGPEVATCLATGCITDTNIFSTDHTTPEVLEVVASLMREGAPLPEIIRNAMHLRTKSDAILWGKILGTMQIEGGVAWASSRRAHREEVGADEGEGSGIATFLRNIIGVQIGILFVEVEPGRTRVSMRSEPGYDVGTLALELGGGGHTLAAGVTLEMELEEAIRCVVSKAQALVQDAPRPIPS